MTDPFSLADDLGPGKIVHVHEPACALRGILVVDNVAAGPAIGGLRMAADVSVEECFRLARAMSLKNAAAGLAHGGGKSVVFGDPRMPSDAKESMLRTFASALRGVEDYIFGPDMGTTEECMAWIRDEMGRALGLPRELGGIPLDEIGATGWGVRRAAEIALEQVGLELSGTRFVVQGFGAVGIHSARFLASEGAVMVGAADSRGAISNPDGIDVEELVALKYGGASVAEWSGGERMPTQQVVEIDCDVLIPAARPDVIHKDNVARVSTSVIVQGANIPITEEAERELHARGVLCVPDFIANAGGVICAAMEYQKVPEASVFPTISDKIGRNTRAVLEDAARRGITPRQSALEMAEARIRQAMQYRRHGIFSSAPHFI
ncbi:MAG: Glu/Leu/Phe/Val dehydrogenase [Gammaproteobacteria bacterium]|nr:Glu/Leu/Phe/Val dehydrogenase [Gammaproteobacteria bacterium]NND37908.1 Glu/Leu/Phe/Val dehydrogenase [Gammaproteobacteria bacterium]